MGIDERLLADPGADVHKHGRHANHAWRKVRAVADGGTARHDSYAGAVGKPPKGQGVFVVERPFAVIHGRVHCVAKPETQEDALLDPGIDPPPDRAGRIRLGRPDRARREGLAQTSEGPPRGLAVRRRSGRREGLDFLLKEHLC